MCYLNLLVLCKGVINKVNVVYKWLSSGYLYVVGIHCSFYASAAVWIAYVNETVITPSYANEKFYLQQHCRRLRK